MFSGCDYKADEDCENRELWAAFARNKNFDWGTNAWYWTNYKVMTNLQVPDGRKNYCFDIPEGNRWERFTDNINSLRFGYML